jgi:hypothetical protein
MSAELFVVRESFPLVLISLSLSTRNSKNITARFFFVRINIYTHREQQQYNTLSLARDKKERERERELKREFRERVCVPVRNNRTGNRESDPRVRCRTVFVVVDSDGRKENTVVVVVAPSSSLFSLSLLSQIKG